MKRLHLFSLANKGYSEKWLRSKDEQGYELISVNAGFIYEFAKNDKESFEYRILPVASENMMGDMSFGDFKDFKEMVKESGWEVVKKTDPLIIKKKKGQKLPEIYEDIDDERRVALAFCKRLQKSSLLSMFTIFISVLGMSKGYLFNNNVASINIIELYFAYFGIFGLLFSICSVLINTKFIILNNKVKQNNVKYFSSASFTFIINALLLYLVVSLVYLLIAIFIRFYEFSIVEQFLLDSTIWVFGIVLLLALVVRFIQPRVR